MSEIERTPHLGWTRSRRPPDRGAISDEISRPCGTAIEASDGGEDSHIAAAAYVADGALSRCHPKSAGRQVTAAAAALTSTVRQAIPA